VEAIMVDGVENGEENQACGADKSEDDGEDGEDLLAEGSIRDQAALVTQPALGDKREVEEDGGDDAAGDEERLEMRGTDVADVGDGLVFTHGRVVLGIGVDNPREEHAKEHAAPDKP
jgi:hypothetical protein